MVEVDTACLESVDEALLFSNNDRIQKEYLRDSKDSLVGYLKGLDKRAQAIEEAFWAVFSRPPHAAEARAFDDYLAQHADNYGAALQQVVWAVLTSPELRFNH